MIIPGYGHRRDGVRDSPAQPGNERGNDRADYGLPPVAVVFGAAALATTVASWVFARAAYSVPGGG